MTIRDWVAGKIRTELGYDVRAEGEHGLAVHRGAWPAARVYSPEASDTEPFGPDQLKQAIAELPGLQFIVVVKRRVANETYPLADEQGVAIAGFNALKSALANNVDISRHRSNEQEYVQGRLDGNAQIESWRRRGENAYEVSLTGGRGNITIVTIQRYELTSDDVYELLAQHDNIEVDAIVTTNPNCQGFAPSTLAAVGDAGTRIMRFRDFLDALGEPWT
ncbi:MAG TPA: hypothetical protein VGL36_35840 [Kribbella sp.]